MPPRRNVLKNAQGEKMLDELDVVHCVYPAWTMAQYLPDFKKAYVSVHYLKERKHILSIGGYDENYIIYEDNMLINELYVRKEFVVINKKIRTSARLYKKHGVWKLQHHFWTIYVKKWFGASADELFAYYKKHI